MNVKRYLFPANGPQIDPVKNAFALAIELRKKNDKDIILYVPTMKNIEGTTIEEALGQKIIRKLKKDKSIGIGKEHKLKLKTKRTFGEKWTSDIILGIYVDEKMLGVLDDCEFATAIIVVPWTMEEVSWWIETWNPIIYGEKDHQKDAKKIIDNPVVEEALKMLTNRINLSTGLSHPSDEASAKELFTLLYKAGELFDPKSIKMWALRNGWASNGANQLKKLQKIY